MLKQKAVIYLLCLSACIGILVPLSVFAQLEITSFTSGGALTWTNSIVSNGVYTIEWSSDLQSGAWKHTYQSLVNIDSSSNTSFSTSVPIFYRVSLSTNEKPFGMVWIEGGTFDMGNAVPDGIDDELLLDEFPVHTVHVDGFYISSHLVCNGLWDSVTNWAATNGYSISTPLYGFSSSSNSCDPVSGVSWHDAVKWCNARSQKDGLQPCYYTSSETTTVYRTGITNISYDCVIWNSDGYRLPTEAEWEKAGRGGRRGLRFPWGNTISHERANYNSSGSAFRFYDVSTTSGFHPYFGGSNSPSGFFPANDFGLHDMSGNSFQWCWDWYGSNYYAVSSSTNPLGSVIGEYKSPASSPARIMRGGSSGYGCIHARVSYREVGEPATATHGASFRCVRSK